MAALQNLSVMQSNAHSPNTKTKVKLKYQMKTSMSSKKLCRKGVPEPNKLQGEVLLLDQHSLKKGHLIVKMKKVRKCLKKILSHW